MFIFAVMVHVVMCVLRSLDCDDFRVEDTVASETAIAETRTQVQLLPLASRQARLREKLGNSIVALTVIVRACERLHRRLLKRRILAISEFKSRRSHLVDTGKTLQVKPT
jgi:hypothetical protein